MGGVITSLMKSIGQLGDPAILRILAKSVLITLAIFALFGGILLYALYDYLTQHGLAFSAGLSGLAAILITLMAGWLLFRIVAIAILQIFADEIIGAVENRHYPAMAQSARTIPLRQDLINSLRGAGRAILYNLIAAPIALFLLFTAIGPAIVFWLVNAIILGRELADMVWLRHQNMAGGQMPISRIDRFAMGGTITALMAIPLVNIFAPIIGAACATHLLQSRMRGKNA